MRTSDIVLFVFIGSMIAIFILREIITWYWKINQIVKLLESIDKRLESAGYSNELPGSTLAGKSDV